MILKRNNERKRAPNIRKKGFKHLTFELPQPPPHQVRHYTG